MVDVQTSEVDAKFASLNVGPWNFDSDRSSEDEHILLRFFCENPKIRTWRQLKIKLNILSYGDNS
jgi:hypothetical protein